MKTVPLSNLPTGAQVRGALYDDPTHVYELGDVLEIELTTGRMIDVGWDADSPNEPFRIVVYNEYFGDRSVDYRVRNIEEVVTAIQSLAVKYSEQCVETSCSSGETLVP